MTKVDLKIDTHIHLAGNGCCNSGIWISEKFKRRYTYRALKFMQKITKQQEDSTIDYDWVKKISHMVEQSQIDYGVVLGFDGVYDRPSGNFNEKLSQLYIPSEWVFKICREFKNLLPGPSVNPYRRDALERLEYCIKEGAVLIKWLPPTQGIDPASAQITEFYKILAASKIPLLVHTGGEKTFATVAHDVNDVNKLRMALDLGVTVICAHSATWPIGDKKDQLASLKQILNDYPHVWLDNSGICNPSRFFHLPHLAEDSLICERTLYGSDWPVPSNAIYYFGKLGPRRVMQLEKIKNPLDRDIAIKQEFGYPEATLTKAHQVLANLDRWVS